MNQFAVRRDSCALDFLSLGALIYRLDPGVIPFRKTRSFDVHVSGCGTGFGEAEWRVGKCKTCSV
jgi:hypothetical protein